MHSRGHLRSQKRFMLHKLSVQYNVSSIYVVLDNSTRRGSKANPGEVLMVL